MDGTPGISSQPFAEATMLTPAIKHFLDTQRLDTPFLVMDLEMVRSNYLEFRAHMPEANVHYALKANPAPEVIRALARLGSSFDVASPREIELCFSLGITPSRLSYGNTIKKARDIAFAYRCGLRTFAFDSQAELEKLAEHAPGSRVICRLLTSGEGAEWPLSRKFGCDLEMAHHLLLLARELELEPYGVSFHVGSQQLNLHAWDQPIQDVAHLFTRLEASGIHLKAINLGGGFPAALTANVASLSEYARAINAALTTHLGKFKPTVMLEPGRGLVGNAGLIQSEVVLISRKSQSDSAPWVYLDVGKFGGLIETMDEAIKYPIHSARTGEKQAVILAGPTCDSADILYEQHPIQLPKTLEIGDRLEILGTGAYTASYASVNFNGFAPLRTYCVDGPKKMITIASEVTLHHANE
jgi:ornithine decarboxylase